MFNMIMLKIVMFTIMFPMYNIMAFNHIQVHESLRSTHVSKPPSISFHFVMLTNVGETSCSHEVISVHDHAKNRHAMQSWISIHKNGTWDLVPLPKGRKAISCKVKIHI